MLPFGDRAAQKCSSRRAFPPSALGLGERVVNRLAGRSPQEGELLPSRFGLVAPDAGVFPELPEEDWGTPVGHLICRFPQGRGGGTSGEKRDGQPRG